MHYSRILLIVLSCFVLWSCQPEDKSTTLIIQLENRSEVSFLVEKAETPEEHTQGLMNRESLPQNAGMLFIFPVAGFHSFWMKNTLIPLDILFITEEGSIGYIHHHALPKDLTPVPSHIPAMYALEINGGLSSKLGIQVGDHVFHEKIKRNLAP